MIKRKYLTILSVAIVAVLLGSLFYNNVAFGGRTPTQVEVINLPTDEQGNLRVTHEPSWKVISVVENFNLTWTPTLDAWWIHSNKIDLGSVNVSGYSRMTLYMRVTNFTKLYQGSPNEAAVRVWYTSVYEYCEIERSVMTSVGWLYSTTAQSVFTAYPTQQTMREIVEPSLRLGLEGMSYTPNGPVLPSISCLVSIGIYLRNE